MWGGTMPFRDIDDLEKLALLAAIVDDICHDAGIDRASPEYEDAAHLHPSGCFRGSDEPTAVTAKRRSISVPDVRETFTGGCE